MWLATLHRPGCRHPCCGAEADPHGLGWRHSFCPSVLAFLAVEVVAALVVDYGSCMFLAGLLVYTSRCVPFFCRQARRQLRLLPSCCRQAQMLGIMVGMDQKDWYEVLVLSLIMRLAMCSPDWRQAQDCRHLGWYGFQEQLWSFFFGRLPLVRRRPGGALYGQQLLVVEG